MVRYRYPGARILVFAKAPIPGQVKSRLIPALGAEEAAALYKRLLWHKLALLEQAELCPLQLWCCPDTEHAFFAHCADHFNLTRHRQRGEDLGERMADALADALQDAMKAVLIGGDCPAMEADYVAAAIEAQDDAEIVLGPAEDGGYVLIGMRDAHPLVFRGIEWGASTVYSRTLERITSAGLSHRTLTPLWDCDRPEDIERLKELKLR